jgi:hypothetical protein
MTGHELVVLVALFTVMMAIVAVGIAVAIHRQRQGHAQEARRAKTLPTASERLRQD